MPSLYEAQRRHAQHYLQLVQQTDEWYKVGSAQMLASLALFDAERGQIDQLWAWIQQQAGQPFADDLLLEYTDATVYTGDLRYDKRTERIPRLTLALAAARRRDRPH